MKLSFSISSKPSSRRNPSSSSLPAQPFTDHPHDPSPSHSQYVTVFDPSQTLTSSTLPPRPAIAPLENTNQWRASKRMKNLVPHSDPSEEAARFVVDLLGTDAAQTATAYGLTVRPKADDNGIEEEIIPPVRVEAASEAQRFKVDIESLPEDRGIEEFQDVAVEDFSRAVLEGYGWREGQGIGKNCKEDAKVVEQRRWAGKSGLGFDSEAPSVGKNDKKDKEKVGRDGRSNGGGKSEVVRVVAGKYAGKKGEVLKNGKGGVVLSLLRSGEKVNVGADMIAELGSAEEERFLRRLKEVDGRRDTRGKDDDNEGRGTNRGRNDERRGRKEETERENSAHRSSDGGKEGESVHWLRSQIKVRVISKNFKGGRLYLKKGVVTDVIDPVTCDILMDETRELLQGVDQEMLETVLPQCGGPVIVLCGRHKGVYGRLMEKDREKEVATVRDADNRELIKVRMEQIAEYIGDPGDIGY